MTATRLRSRGVRGGALRAGAGTPSSESTAADGTELDSPLVTDNPLDLAVGSECSRRRPVRGTWRRLSSPDDVLTLMDTSAEGVVACVADAGATFLAPIFDELTAVVCLSGTPLSHIGIVSREYQVPCVMSRGVLGRGARRRRRGRGRLLRSRRCRPAGVVTRAARRGLGSRSVQRVVPVPQRDLVRAHDAAHRARVGADPRHRVHRRRVCRVLPALSRRWCEEIADAVPPEELGHAGHRPRDADRPVHLWAVPNFTLLGRKVLAGRGLLDVEQDVQNIAPVLRLLGARRARVPLRRRHASGVGRRRRRDARTARYVEEIASECRPLATRRCARAHGAPERAGDVVPVPALVRYPVRLPGHGSVPPRRRAGAAAAVVQPARRLALPVERRGVDRAAVLATCSPRSCSTTVSSCASPTSARR